MDAIATRQADRMKFLRALYDASGGERKPFDEPIIAAAAGLSPEAATAAADYVKGKGLVQYLGGSGKHRGVYVLTAAGVDEIERAHANPNRPTEHLPPWSVVFNIGTMNNSQIQAASHASTQSMTVTHGDLTTTREVIAALADAVSKARLPDDMRAEVSAEIAVVQAQVASPKPKPSIILPALISIKTIIEGGLGEYIGSAWVPKIADVLRTLGS
jgi:hypothetical protein